MWLRRIFEFLSVLSIIVILMAGWYFVIQQNTSLPQWAGYVFSSFTGGLLALIGGYIASLLSRQTERIRLEREHRLRQISIYREYLESIYFLLARHILSQKFAEYDTFIAQNLELTDKDIQNIVTNLPPLEELSLIRDNNLHKFVEKSIQDGVLLLLERQDELSNDYRERVEFWSDDCQSVLNKIDRYERAPF